MGRNPYGSIFCIEVCPAKLDHTCRCKSGLARDLGNCLQSRNVPFGTSGDYLIGNSIRSNKNVSENAFQRKFGVKKNGCQEKRW